MVDENNNNKDDMTIETTIGDLICAIADAAEETSVKEEELSEYTHLILSSMLNRKKS